MKSTRAAAVVLAALILSGRSALASVVISEVHYHPPAADGERLEFVELHNATDSALDLSGWQLSESVEFTFPDGATVAPGGYAVVARNRAALRERFGLTEEGLYGDFHGSLENKRGSILVLDAFGAYVDRFVYSDGTPWPSDADGEGSSLQKVCLESDAVGYLNWAGAAPTPLAEAPASQCPPPSFTPPAVVINEIHYHPLPPDETLQVGEDGEDREYVELHNPGDVAIDLGGWRLDDGVVYQFPRDTTIAPGGFVLVGRDAEALRSWLGLQDSDFVGEYDGRLSNGGERLTLWDAAGILADSVAYADSGDWPYAADGEGHSLERISATAFGEDPANWAASTVVRDEFQLLTAEGPGGGGLAQRFILSLAGTGEVLVDDVVLEDLRSPGTNLLENGDFENMLEGWTLHGNAQSSVWEPAGGVGGSGALHLTAVGPCPFGECGSSNGVATTPSSRLTTDTTYRVTLMVKFLSGHVGFSGGVFGGVQATPEFPTPGARNSVSADSVPPFIDYVGRFPREPTAADATWLTAHVRSLREATVTLNFSLGEDGDVQSVEMLDDGMNRDGQAGDGVYGVRLPPFPHNTQVRYFVTATSAGLSRDYPHLKAPGQALPEELAGYYVSDLPKDSPFPTYDILIEGVDGSDWAMVNDSLNCTVLRRASFAVQGDLYPDVGLRWRGNTACVIDKRNFKVRFNRAHFFKGARKLNLNSQWTDKAFVREHLAWELIDEIGAPAVETEYVRVNVSGSYYGLYVCLEHPDQRFLERIGLDPDGNLYKAKQPPGGDNVDAGVGPQNPGEYDRFWEKETNERTTFADVEEFITSMHADAGGADGPTADFWLDRAFPEMIMGFQLSQVLLSNFDSALKNHFLYHDLAIDRWGFITWDMDLVMGKYFTHDAVDRQEGRQVGTLNDLMVGDFGAQPRVIGPFFFTTLDRHGLWNYLLDYFFRAGEDYFQRAYLVRLWNLVQEKYNNRVYDPRIDDLVDLIFEEQLVDFERWGRYPSNVEGFPDDMLSNVDIVKAQIGAQHDFLERSVRILHPKIPDQPKLLITEIMYEPPQGDDDLEFLELVNASSLEVDLSGWSIVGGIDFTFPLGAMAPPGAVMIVARDPNAFAGYYSRDVAPLLFGPYEGKLANDGEVLRVLDSGSAAGVPDAKQSYPATVDYLAYGSGGDWPEVPPGHSLQLRRVAGDADNDRPEAWAVSAEIGGGPGVIPRTFIRGDLTDDGTVNITDAIQLLGHLFQGQAGPSCLDTADVNDDGTVNVTDAIALLNHLFGGREAPKAPYPERGSDPTPDDLACGV